MENKLINILSSLKYDAVFFGPQGFLLMTSESTFEQAQLGFGRDEDGLDLSGSSAGDWQSSWQVIARDTELGDPYFVDTNDHELPVYTAFLGESGWECEQVSSTLTGFVDCMHLLQSHGEQSQAQFFPDDKTVVDDVKLANLQQQLTDISSAVGYWQYFFRCYQDWLHED